jgi:hypothetical protein
MKLRSILLLLLLPSLVLVLVNCGEDSQSSDSSTLEPMATQTALPTATIISATPNVTPPILLPTPGPVFTSTAMPAPVAPTTTQAGATMSGNGPKATHIPIAASTPATTTKPKPKVTPVLLSQVIVVQIAAGRALAHDLGLGEGALKVNNIEPVHWSDTSLGCWQDNLVYVQVITPGYKIVFERNGMQYEVHTNLDASEIARCEGTGPPTPTPRSTATPTPMPIPTPTPILTPNPIPTPTYSPVPISTSHSSMSTDEVIRAFTEEAIAIEEKRNAMVSIASGVAPAFRGDLAKAYVDGYADGLWAEGIKVLRQQLASIKTPLETQDIKRDLLHVYDLELRSIEKSLRTDVIFRTNYLIDYWSGFYPSITKNNVNGWGAAVTRYAKDALKWRDAQKARRIVYRDWEAILLVHDIDLGGLNLSDTSIDMMPADENVHRAEIENQERFEQELICLRKAPNPVDSIKVWCDPRRSIYILEKLGTSTTFEEYLDGTHGRPEGGTFKAALRYIAETLNSTAQSSETREISITEKYSYPEAAYFAVATHLQATSSQFLHLAVERATRAEFLSRKTIEPGQNFIVYMNAIGRYAPARTPTIPVD